MYFKHDALQQPNLEADAGSKPGRRHMTGLAKRWQARHRCRLCCQAQRWSPGPVSRARSGAHETLAGVTQVSFVLPGAAFRGPGPVPRACARGLAKRWQARRRCRLCCQAQRWSPGPVSRVRSGAREMLAGATQVSFVLPGAAFRGPGPAPCR